MTIQTAEYLISEPGRQLTSEVAVLVGDAATKLLILRKRGTALEIATGVIELLTVRQRAHKRFGGDEDRLFLTVESLAQATSPTIAAYHARFLVSANCRTVVDLGCGIGMDSIAFARAGLHVTAIERDAARLVFARANAEACGVADHIDFLYGDATKYDGQADAFYCDPSRRNENSRRVSRHGDLYEPSLDVLKTVMGRAKVGLVKLSPALPDDVLCDLGGNVSFLSDGRECKEACVQFGGSQSRDEMFRAVLLPDTTVFAADNDGEPPIASTTQTYLYDPDPAIVRARALGDLCRRFDVALFSGDDAYLTGSNEQIPHRVASAYRIVETMPYQPRKVARWLKERQMVRLVLKKRHFPGDADAIVRQLGLRTSGTGESMTLILVRRGSDFIAVLGEAIFQPIKGTILENDDADF